MAMHESDHRVMRLVEALARGCAQQLLIEAVGCVSPRVALKFSTQHRQCPRKCTQTAPEIVLFPHAASVKPSSNPRPLLKSRSLVTFGTIPERWKAQAGVRWDARNLTGRKTPPRRGFQGLEGSLRTPRNPLVVPAPGFELGTYRLQGGCSTN
jgi:hypothetical protein